MKTQKTILILIALSVMAIFSTKAQTPGFEWATQSGGDSLIWGYSIAVDATGNKIITGHFKGTADFDPNPTSAFFLTSNGLDDIFIQKLDISGNLLWAANMGDVNNDHSYMVNTDATGNIYVTGFFNGTIDADPGPGVFLLSQTKNSAFVLKIEPDGDLIWAKQMGFPGDWGLARGYSITVDNNDNVLTGGLFVGRVDFDPGAGTFNLSASGTGDAFIQKLDVNGNFVWAKQIKGRKFVNAYSVATDESGNVYTCGWFSGTCDFDPDNKKKYNMTSYGDDDAYILKLNENGDFVWAKQIGGNQQNIMYSLALDSFGNLYTTGYFYGTTDFDPGSGIYNMTSFGLSDIFLLKLDLNGNYVWARQIGGSSYDTGHSLVTDSDGNIYTTGYFYATADFNPDPTATYYLTVNGGDDCFLYKSDPNGDLLWVTQTGGTGHDWGFDVALDASGNIFTTGVFDFITDFDPSGNNVFELTNSGEQDMFLQKLNSTINNDCPVPAGLNATNITETSADLSWDAVTNAVDYNVRYRGIDSTDWTTASNVGINPGLTIVGLTAATSYEFQVQTTCVSNFSYSYEFTTMGGAGGGGCIDNYEPNESMATAASIPVNTDIEALIDEATDTDWFQFNNAKRKKNIQITLTNLPANYDVALYDAGGTLLATSQNSGTSDEIITYNTSTVGTYYVNVYGFEGAHDPSSCYTLVASIKKSLWKSAVTGVNNDEESMDISVYPNPASTILNISLSSPTDEAITLRFMDMSGKTFKMYNLTAVEEMNQYKITLDDFHNGLYFIELTKGSNRIFRKVIINK